MTKEQKALVIDNIAAQLNEYPHFYVTDIEALNAEQTATLRRKCFENDIKLIVVKNTLLGKALEKIKSGWTDVDVIICTPNVMGKVGALGRILGPRGLMPNPKTGTVTMEVGKAVQDVKAGKIDFKVDKFGIIHTAIGKVSFTPQQIEENAKEVLGMILKLKPSAAKGTYVRSIYLSTTMSPGVQVDTKSVEIK